MHVMVPTLLEIVMIQFVLNVNLTSIITPHLNAIGNALPTDPLTTIHLRTIQVQIHMKLITMQSLNCNFLFQPTNWTKWPNY